MMLRNEDVDVAALLARIEELERKVDLLVEDHATRCLQDGDSVVRHIRLTEPSSPMLPENM